MDETIGVTLTEFSELKELGTTGNYFDGNIRIKNNLTGWKSGLFQKQLSSGFRDKELAAQGIILNGPCGNGN